jgi:hypothetical protein
MCHRYVRPRPEPLWAFVLRILAHVTAIVASIVAVWRVLPTITTTEHRVEQLGASVARGQFTVEVPRDGDTVGLASIARGTTPYLDRNLYIVVTSLESGRNYVMADHVAIHPGGLWAGTATYGEMDVGIGETYFVRCFATTETVRPGELARLPTDGIFSMPVTVTRTR